MAESVKCPFYNKHSVNKVHCEGKVHSFATRDDRFEYMQEYCRTFEYNKCTHAKQLLKSYNCLD